MHGSAGLIQTLLAEDLVDELRVIVFPVTLGEGKRLFGEGAIPRTWRLKSHTTTPSGAVMLSYERGRRGRDRLRGPRVRLTPGLSPPLCAHRGDGSRITTVSAQRS